MRASVRQAGTMPASEVKGKTLRNLGWEHTFVDELPGDPDESGVEGGQPRQVHGALYSRVEPTDGSNKPPYLIAHSREAAALLDLDESECTTSDFAKVFGGKDLSCLREASVDLLPFAQNYGGHQVRERGRSRERPRPNCTPLLR